MFRILLCTNCGHIITEYKDGPIPETCSKCGSRAWSVYVPDMTQFSTVEEVLKYWANELMEGAEKGIRSARLIFASLNES